MSNTIVASTTITQPTGSSRQAHVIYAANSARWWAFYLSAATTLASLYSTDGATWTAGATLTVASLADGGEFAIAYANISSTDVLHLSVQASGSSNDAHYRGTISGTTLTWSGVTNAAFSGGASGHGAGTCISSGGNIADGANAFGDGQAVVWPNADSGSSWTAGSGAVSDVYSAPNNVFVVGIQPTGSGKSFIFLCDDGQATSYGAASYTLKWTQYNGTSWGAAATVSGVTTTNEDLNSWGLCRLSDSDIHLVHRTGSNTYEHKRFNGTSWSSGSSITTQTSLDTAGIALVSDGTSVWMFIVDSAAGNNVKYCSWTSGGGWTSWTALESTSATRNYLGVCPQQGSSKYLVYWTEGTGSPWSIKCALLSVGGGGTNWNKSLTDATSALDTPTWTAVKTLLDAMSETDSLSKTPGKSLQDAISALDTLSKVSFKVFLDWLSERDSVTATKLAVVNLGDKQSALDGLARAVSKALLDNFSEIDTFARVWQAHLTLLEGISQLDSLSKMPTHVFADWLSATDTVSAAKLAGTNWQRTLSDSHSALDVLLKTPGKWVTDQISALDLFSRVWTAHLTLQESVSEADSWAKGVVKLNQESISETDTLTRTAQYFRQAFDGLSETDQIAIGKLLLVQLLDAAGLTDQVSTLLQHPLGQFALAQVISLVAAQLGMTIGLLVGTDLVQTITNFASGPLAESISNF